MMMRSIATLICILVLTNFGSLSAQTEYVDSMRKALETATEDTTILNINLELSKEFSVLTPDEVMAYAEKAIMLARDQGNRKKEFIKLQLPIITKANFEKRKRAGIYRKINTLRF